MTRKRSHFSLRSDSHGPASTIAALVLVALVPAVCILWFMTVAMRNERLAVHEQLSGVYQSHLSSVERDLADFWNARQSDLQSATNGSPFEVFASIIRSNLAESVVIYDAGGTVLYPTQMEGSSPGKNEEHAGWALARELEFQKMDNAAAAEAYAKISDIEENVHLRARALQSQAGCLLKAGQTGPALDLMVRLTSDSSIRNAMSAQGSLIAPNVQLLILKLDDDPASERRRESFNDLRQRLNDYSSPNFSSSQRRFLMEELVAAGTVEALFPTLEAERLAAQFLEQDGPMPAGAGLQKVSGTQFWNLTTPDKTRTALFRESRLTNEISSMIRSRVLPDVSIGSLPPGSIDRVNSPVSLQDAGVFMPGWQLALSFTGEDPFAVASRQQKRFYLSIGVCVVLIIVVLAVLVARYVGAQMRLARLKNDLVSTVSHELKTPLASMRALVDTLSAGRYRSEQQLQEYLHLISKENQRLSHLIENFLAFSRMERGKQRFQFEDLSPESVVNDAADALKEKLQSSEHNQAEANADCETSVSANRDRDSADSDSAPVRCDLKLELDSELPLIRGDRDALTTVLINLIDNAFKYTESDKQICVRVRANGQYVYFEITDNGIGLSPEEVKSVFDRFYQADQSLTRQRGGCGLGLSIVQYIVKAHNGVVEVESEPAKGSTFRIKLPIANEERSNV